MFRRFQRWLGRFLGITSSAGSEESPELILERQKAFFSEKIVGYDHVLASRAALCEVLRKQIQETELEQARLDTALRVQATAVTPDDAASDLALRWEAASSRLADLQAQFDAAKQSCKDIAEAREESIREARAKLAELALKL